MSANRDRKLDSCFALFFRRRPVASSIAFTKSARRARCCWLLLLLLVVLLLLLLVALLKKLLLVQMEGKMTLKRADHTDRLWSKRVFILIIVSWEFENLFCFSILRSVVIFLLLLLTRLGVVPYCYWAQKTPTRIHCSSSNADGKTLYDRSLCRCCHYSPHSFIIIMYDDLDCSGRQLRSVLYRTILLVVSSVVRKR